jgi:hypothetical protein
MNEWVAFNHERDRTAFFWEDSLSKFDWPCFRARKPRICNGNLSRKTGRDTSCRLSAVAAATRCFDYGTGRLNADAF